MKEVDMDFDNDNVMGILSQIGHSTLRTLFHLNAVIEFARKCDGVNVKKFFDANKELVDELFVKTSSHSSLNYIISKNGIVDGDEGMTLWNEEFDIVKRFLPEDAITVEREDYAFEGDWNDHAYFVKWSDIMQIDFDKFDKFINESVNEFVETEMKYKDVKKEYNEYLEIQQKFDIKVRGR